MKGKRNPHPAAAAAATTIYETIGGEKAVRAVMWRSIISHRRGYRSPSLFRAEMEALKKSQVIFFCQLLGGPQQYRGPDIRQLHAGMKIEQRHFDRVAQHLVASLRPSKSMPPPLTKSSLWCSRMPRIL